MILGTVNVNKEPLIPLTVLHAKDEERELAFLMDTGYDGYLSLPPHLIAELGLSSKGLLVPFWLMAHPHGSPFMRLAFSGRAFDVLFRFTP